MVFNYLKEIRNLYETSSVLLDICFILGSNTCDMDSALSTYLLSIGKNIKHGAITLSKKGKPSINSETKKIYLPVLNIKRGTLHYRIDVKYVFDKFGINENDFWYISDEVFNPHHLFSYKYNRYIKTSIILVDHTILDREYLSDYVAGIYDHHLLSTYNNQYKNLKSLNIKYPIGSCSTLILREYFEDDDFPIKIVSPVLALTAILLDTKKFNPDFYGLRWVDLDRKVYKRIKKVIKKNEEIKIKMKHYFQEIKDIKHDINLNLSLGFEALMMKDQKFYNWDKIRIIWSSFQIPFYVIKNKFGDKEILNHYMELYKGKANEEIKNTFIVTSSSLKNKQRLFTIFNPFKMPFNKGEIQQALLKQLMNYLYSVDINDVFAENGIPNGKVCHIIVSNIYSRKSFEPVLKDIFSNFL
jgi:inorganic pyrophosphatase/exopolyphosphatase